MEDLVNCIAITGATSMLGLSLIEECIKNNVSVLAFVHKNSQKLNRLPNSPLVEIIECNLKDISNIDVKDKKCEVFYHFAWSNTDKKLRDYPEPQLQNLKYALDAVELAIRLGCKKFVGAGSQAEYGINFEKLSPTTKVNPVTSYGVAKFAAGKLCTKLCAINNIVCVWPRIFSVYGIYENSSALISYLIDCYKKGETAMVSSAMQNWEYLYQTDAARFLFALGIKCNKSAVYTLSSKDTRPLKDYILEFQQITGGKLKVEFAKPTNNPIVSLNSDISDLIRDTKVEPIVSFAQGVKLMIQSRTELENKRYSH